MCRVKGVTNEASNASQREPQHNDDVEHANIDTEFESVCCNYSKQLTGKCLTFDPATILYSIRLRLLDRITKIYLR